MNEIIKKKSATLPIWGLGLIITALFGVNTYFGFCNSFGEARATKDYEERYSKTCRSFDILDRYAGYTLEIYAIPASLSFKVADDLKGDPLHPISFSVTPTVVLLIRAIIWILIFFWIQKIIKKKELSQTKL